jgi:putative transposase
MECGGLPPLSESGSKLPHSTSWPHAPVHHLCDSGTYFVTTGTYLKQHYFREPSRLDVLQRGLLTVTTEYNWHLEAWCVFSNHYHFVAHSPADGADTLTPMLRRLHSKLAIWVNKLDNTSGRQVWHNFRDTRLTYEPSYLARLHYTHANAVHHGLVSVANQYPWCSAAWFERTATHAQIKTIYGMKIDTIRVEDDFNMECGGLPPLSESGSKLPHSKCNTKRITKEA